MKNLQWKLGNQNKKLLLVTGVLFIFICLFVCSIYFSFAYPNAASDDFREGIYLRGLIMHPAFGFVGLVITCVAMLYCIILLRRQVRNDNVSIVINDNNNKVKVYTM